jgi:hypothetical protein
VLRIAANVAKLAELLQRRSNKAVLTVVGAVYGGVLEAPRGSIRHGSISYRARSDSRGWRCFFLLVIEPRRKIYDYDPLDPR